MRPAGRRAAARGHGGGHESARGERGDAGWRETLQAIGALTDVVEAEKEEKEEEEEENEDAQEEVDAQGRGFAQRMARQLESFCVEPLEDRLGELELLERAAKLQ